jgi:DNA invertase Pin-like site-specific DNA recombinase
VAVAPVRVAGVGRALHCKGSVPARLSDPTCRRVTFVNRRNSVILIGLTHAPPRCINQDIRAFSLSHPDQWVAVCIRYERNLPEKRLIGYARVSTYGQTLDSQLDQLRKAGCSSRNIYREKVTGARADRRELNRMLGKLAPGDVVTVTRIDRLARSTFDLFGIVKRIVDAKAQFRSLAEPWADSSSSSTGRLMLAVLGSLADVERDLIRTRTAEGRERAKARGKHMGRPPSLTPAQQKEAIRRRAQGATLDELARSYNVSRATISRLER